MRIETRSNGPLRPAATLHACCLFFLYLASAGVCLAEQDKEHAHEHEHDEHDITETVVVTASPFAHDRDELAIPVDRIDRDALLRNLGSTLGETIDHIPGITTTGFAAGASRPVIRGQDAFRTEILEDGIETHDVSRESPDHAVAVNLVAARRVEVVRGPAALRYGGGATAGVVNTITNRVPDRLPTDAIAGDVFAGIGLVADERDIAATLDGGHGPFAFHADGVLRTANNYSIPNDGNPHTQSESQTNSYAGSIGGAFLGSLGRVGASYTRVENDYGIPETGDSVDIEMQTDRFRFEGDLDTEIPGVREIRVRGVYSDYEHREIANGITGQIFRNEEFEGRLELIHQEVAGFLGAIGMHGGVRDFRDARFYGGEISGELDLFEFEFGTIGLDSRFDIVQARFRNGSNRKLPRIVPIRYGGGVFFAADDLDFRIGVLRTETQEDTARFESATAGFTMLNASFAYRVSLLDDRMPMEFSIQARNLTDVRATTSPSTRMTC